MHGLLLIDKPTGISSHDVVRRVRRVFATRKVGHAGTLDPLATGVLPVAIGEGTKLLQFLLAEDKAYRATMRLGITTDTLDAEGEVLQCRSVPDDAAARLEPLLDGFCGSIDQVPPMFSAIKRNGVPLYKLARSGQEVERQPRQVRIDRLELISTALPEIDLEVECSKGTYIRSLCADLGDALGCGAHVSALRRLRTGQFEIDRCIPLDELEDPARVVDSPAFLAVDEALYYYPAVELDADAAGRLKNGVPPATDGLVGPVDACPGELIRLVAGGRLLAMARYAPQRERERRGDFELLRVFCGGQGS